MVSISSLIWITGQLCGCCYRCCTLHTGNEMDFVSNLFSCHKGICAWCLSRLPSGQSFKTRAKTHWAWSRHWEKEEVKYIYPPWILQEICSSTAKILIASLNPNAGLFGSADTLEVNSYSWKASLKVLQLWLVSPTAHMRLRVTL